MADHATTSSAASPASSVAESHKYANANQLRRWMFPSSVLTKSQKDNISAEDEAKYRRNAARFVQDLCDKLNHERPPREKISHLAISTALIYMHRFYMFHSFRVFDGRDIAATCVFLSAKTEECPKKLELIVCNWWIMKFPREPPLVIPSRVNPQNPNARETTERYQAAADLIATLENILLQTIAFDLQVEVPHTHVIRGMAKILPRALPSAKHLTESAYQFAAMILHLTDYCVRYPPCTLAAICVNMTFSWAGTQIPLSEDGKPWYYYMDRSLDYATLERLTAEFLSTVKRENKNGNLTINKMLAAAGPVEKALGPMPTSTPAAPVSGSGSLAPPPPPPNMKVMSPRAHPQMAKRPDNPPTAVLDINRYKERMQGATVAGGPPEAQKQPSVSHTHARPAPVTPHAPRDAPKVATPNTPSTSIERRNSFMPDMSLAAQKKYKDEHRGMVSERSQAASGAAMYPTPPPSNKRPATMPEQAYRPHSGHDRQKEKDKERERRHQDQKRKEYEQKKQKEQQLQQQKRSEHTTPSSGHSSQGSARPHSQSASTQRPPAPPLPTAPMDEVHGTAPPPPPPPGPPPPPSTGHSSQGQSRPHTDSQKRSHERGSGGSGSEPDAKKHKHSTQHKHRHSDNGSAAQHKGSSHRHESSNSHKHKDRTTHSQPVSAPTTLDAKKEPSSSSQPRPVNGHHEKTGAGDCKAAATFGTLDSTALTSMAAGSTMGASFFDGSEPVINKVASPATSNGSGQTHHTLHNRPLVAYDELEDGECD